MGVFLYPLPRGILCRIYPRIASRMPNKQSSPVVTKEQYVSCPRNRAKLHVYFAKADYHCLKSIGHKTILCNVKYGMIGNDYNNKV